MNPAARLRVDAAATAMLVIGLGELVASRRQRSIVDPVGRVLVDTVPLPVVEATVRFLATWDKPLARAGIIATTVATTERIAATVRPAPARPAGGPALAAALGLGAYLAGRRRLAAHVRQLDAARPTIAVSEPLPAGTDGAEDWDGAAALFTPVEEFYVTDVNLRPVAVDLTGWRLDVHGPGGAGGTLSHGDLLALGVRERDAILICIHQRLGWDRLGHQRWAGVPVTDVLAAAGVELPPAPEAWDLAMTAVDGYSQVLPLDRALTDDAWVVLGMGGRALPAAHGFPARVMTPGVVGQYNGVKWLRELAVSPAEARTATWVARGWPRETGCRRRWPGSTTPVTCGCRRSCRDAPRSCRGTSGSSARPGRRPTAASTGWTCASTTGRGRPPSWPGRSGPASWRRWRHRVQLTPGRHAVAARCVAARRDGAGPRALATVPGRHDRAPHCRRPGPVTRRRLVATAADGQDLRRVGDGGRDRRPAGAARPQHGRRRAAPERHHHQRAAAVG